MKNIIIAQAPSNSREPSLLQGPLSSSHADASSIAMVTYWFIGITEKIQASHQSCFLNRYFAQVKTEAKF